jgi:hypothetical protein
MIVSLPDIFIRVADYIVKIYLICVYLHQTTLDRIVAAVVLTEIPVRLHHPYC